MEPKRELVKVVESILAGSPVRRTVMEMTGRNKAHRYETEETAQVLYAVKDGDEDWQEVLLTEDPALFEDAKKWAKENGYGRFRMATIDLSTPPDFAKTVQV